jgi:hypothetical protein
MDPFLHCLLLLCCWKVHCFIHELQLKDCSHDSASNKQNSSFPNSSPICNSLQSCSIYVMAKMVEHNGKLLLNSHLGGVGVILEDEIGFNGSNNGIKSEGSDAKFLTKLVRARIFELDEDMVHAGWTPWEVSMRHFIVVCIHLLYILAHPSLQMAPAISKALQPLCGLKFFIVIFIRHIQHITIKL